MRKSAQVNTQCHAFFIIRKLSATVIDFYPCSGYQSRVRVASFGLILHRVHWCLKLDGFMKLHFLINVRSQPNRHRTKSHVTFQHQKTIVHYLQRPLNSDRACAFWGCYMWVHIWVYFRPWEEIEPEVGGGPIFRIFFCEGTIIHIPWEFLPEMR